MAEINWKWKLNVQLEKNKKNTHLCCKVHWWITENDPAYCKQDLSSAGTDTAFETILVREHQNLIKRLYYNLSKNIALFCSIYLQLRRLLWKMNMQLEVRLFDYFWFLLLIIPIFRCFFLKSCFQTYKTVRFVYSRHIANQHFLTEQHYKTNRLSTWIRVETGL